MREDVAVVEEEKEESADWESAGGNGRLVTNDWWADAAELPAEVSLASKKRTGTLQNKMFFVRFLFV